MLKKITFTAFLSIIVFCSLFAEEPADSVYYKTWIMGVPQHLFNNGIRIEVDKNLGSAKKWIVVAPSFYYRGQQGNWWLGNYHVESMSGAALDILYRNYIVELGPNGGPYLSGGAGYRYISQNFTGNMWDEHTENNLGYYYYNDDEWSRITHTASVKFLAGYKFIADKHLAVDFFSGGALKYSWQNIPGEVVNYFATDAFEFGVTGFVWVAGIRFGVGW